MMHEYKGIPLIGWIGLIIIIFTQSILLFLDARRRGHNKWFWGIWGLIQFPLPTIFYLLLARKIYKHFIGN